MVPIIPSIAKTLSSLLSFSWPPLSSSFPLVITILVANVFIFLTRLTEQRIRRRAGGRAGHAAEPQPGRGPGRPRRRKAKRRRRKTRWRTRRRPPAPASFSRAPPIRWPPPAGAGRPAPDPARAAHVPVRRWRGVRAAWLSPGGAPGLLMPRAGLGRRTGDDGDRGRGVPNLPRAELCAPAGKEGRAGGVEVPAGEGHLGGDGPRGFKGAGEAGGVPAPVRRPGWGRARAPPPAPAPRRRC